MSKNTEDITSISEALELIERLRDRNAELEALSLQFSKEKKADHKLNEKLGKENEALRAKVKDLGDRNEGLVHANEELVRKRDDLAKENADLAKANDDLAKENADLRLANEALRKENELLTALRDKAFQMAFGVSSEKSRDLNWDEDPSAQAGDGEDEVPGNEIEDDVSNGLADDLKKMGRGKAEKFTKERTRKYVRHKARNATAKVKAGTHVVRIRKEVETRCGACGHEMEQVGEKVHRRLVRVEILIIEETVIPIMKCRRCSGETGPRKPDPDILADTICTPAMLARTLVDKFQRGVPLSRQERDLEEGKISRHSLSNWSMMAGIPIAGNLIPLLLERVYGYPLVNCDETGIKVVKTEDETPVEVVGDSKTGKACAPSCPDAKDSKKKDGEKKKKDETPGHEFHHNAHMVSMTGVDRNGKPRDSVFTFTLHKKNEDFEFLLKPYKGCLQTDGLTNYNTITANNEGMVHLGCLTHARRKVWELGKTSATEKLLSLYGHIFHADKPIVKAYQEGSIDWDECIRLRREKTLPRFEALKKECERIVNDEKTPADDRLRSAVKYFLNRYDQLVACLDHPFATLSNQLAEQMIRPFVVARKNFLFCFTEAGADVTAAYHSLIQTCKLRGIDPELYLTHLFMNCGNLKNGDREGWGALLPGCDLSDAKERMELYTNPPEGYLRTEEPVMLRGNNTSKK